MRDNLKGIDVYDVGGIPMVESITLVGHLSFANLEIRVCVGCKLLKGCRINT